VIDLFRAGETAMKLTPQARRLIGEAIGFLSDPSARDRWSAWAAQGDHAELSYPVAQIALRALETAADRIEKRLGSESLDEDSEADLLNDLGYIRAIKTALEPI
jgi:hypothetical protein